MAIVFVEKFLKWSRSSLIRKLKFVWGFPKGKLFAIAAVIVIAASVPLSVILTQKETKTRSRAVGTPTPPSLLLASPTPSLAVQSYFPLGVFMTAGEIGDMAANITDLKAHGLDSVIFNNTGVDTADSLLSTSDQMNFNSVVAFDYNLWRTWWPDTIPATLANAESAIGPLVDRVKGHPSLRGYNVVDEPGLNMKDKLALAIQVFHNHDSVHPAAPVLIGESIIPTLFDYSKPDVMLLDVYPVSFHSQTCELRLNDYIDVVDYIRDASATRPLNKPLWFILQAHDIGDGSESWHLRLPSPEEARMQQWIAMGEGGTGIFWFIYRWGQGPSGGLVDNPALYAEVADLARRTSQLKNTLLGAKKVTDKIVVDSPTRAYVSTLESLDGTKNYVIAVNRTCSNTSLILKSGTLSGQLKDLETGQIYSLNTPIPFRAGDGKMFEVINPPTPSPTPLPQQASLSFKIKFQGIGISGSDKDIRVTLKGGQIFENVLVKSDSLGIYSGTIGNITPGIYEVLIKDSSHLQKNFGSVTFVVGQTVNKDWSNFSIRAGDFNNDNRISIEDLGLILSVYTQFSVQVNPQNRIYDVNSDNFISIEEIAFILSNYTDFSIPGDS